MESTHPRVTGRPLRADVPGIHSAERKLHSRTVSVLAVIVAILVMLASFAVVGASHAAALSPPPIPGLAATRGGSPVPAEREGSAALHPGVGALGTVISTTDLEVNRVLPGNTAPPVQADPLAVVYDTLNGAIYVRGGMGETLTVVNATTDRVTTSLSLPASANPYGYAPSLLFDPLNGNLYAMNWNTGNISIINGTTNRITGSMGTALAPTSAVLDPMSGDIYVSDWTDDNVSVWDGADNHFVASIAVGTHPDGLLFDPASNEVFVEDLGSGNISVIDTLTNQAVKSIGTGLPASSPQVLALDTHDNDVDVGSATTYNLSVISATSLTVVAHPYVSYDSDGLAYSPRQNKLFVENGGEGNVTVFNQSENQRVVANITTGTDPEGIAFDPVDQDVYVLNSEVSNITVIDPMNDHIVASVATADGLVYQEAVDTNSGNVFAASEGTYSGPPSVRGLQGNITVVADATNLPIASIPLNVWPVGLTYDPANGDLIAADVGGQDLYVVDPTTGLSVGTVPAGFAWSSVYDSLTGDLWVLNRGSENITVLNAGLHSIANLTTGSGPTAIAFDSANGDIYVTDDAAGDVWVFNGATKAFAQTIPVKAFDGLNAILYDPHNQEVYVSDPNGENLTIINGTSQRTVGSIPTGLGTLSLAFDSTNDTIWAANSGNFTVIRDSTNRSVASVADTYASGTLAYDPANNVMYDPGNFESIVSGIGASNYTLLGTLSMGENYYTTDVAYVPSVQEVYVSTADNGMLSVIGRPPTLYPVTFVETGLPANTPWGVTLGGSPNSSMTTTIGFKVANSTPTFTVGMVTGYTVNVSSGSVTVNGAGRTVYLGFTPIGPTYSITFQESGLPATTMWTVSLEGSAMSSTTASIVFGSEPSGSYSYTVLPVAGYGATPSSGLAVVSGSSITEDIAFAPGSGALHVTLSAAPATISLGGSTNLTTVTSAGTPPFGFVYTGLPVGCLTADSSVLPCTPTTVGSFTVTVTVTDDLGHSAEANATLTITGPTSNPPSSISSWLWIIIVVVVIALALVFFSLSRRRKARPLAPAYSPPPPPTPPPPPE
jgi:YVTN family beta-propeller protein